MERVPQEERPDRKVYHITAAGRAELIRWLSGPPPFQEPRSAPLVQVFFAGQLSDEQILVKFEGFAAAMRFMLSIYEQVPAQIGPFETDITSPREHYFWMLTLDNGIRNMRANLAWAEDVIAQIKAGKVPPE